MSAAEWESLCNGCGKCRLILLEEATTKRPYETDVACTLFDVKRRRCTDYQRRSQRVKDCATLSAGKTAALDWMPETCAYRRLAEGKDLPDWRPLRTGTRKSVEEAGAAVMSAVPESAVDPETIWDRVTGVRPQRRRPRVRRMRALQGRKSG